MSESKQREVKPQQPEQTDTMPDSPVKGSVVLYVVELVKRLPPAALLVLAMGGLYWIGRSDLREQDKERSVMVKEGLEGLHEVKRAIDDQGEKLIRSAEKAHNSFLLDSERNRDCMIKMEATLNKLETTVQKLEKMK